MIYKQILLTLSLSLSFFSLLLYPRIFIIKNVTFILYGCILINKNTCAYACVQCKFYFYARDREVMIIKKPYFSGVKENLQKSR